MDASSELVKFAIADSAIATMASEFMPLTINGIADTEGFNRVHSARMVVKAKRVNVEKVRRELKADALEYGRKVDAEAERITAMLEPIESHLITEEDAYKAEKERVRNEARLKAEAEAKAKAEAEAARLEAERQAQLEAMRIEREKLNAERRAMEAERAKVAAAQKAEQDRIDAERRKVEAEQKRLADEEVARQRAIAIEDARKEAAERSRIETEKRLAREAELKAAREKAAKDAAEAARIKAEMLRPDREKLLAVADAVAAIEVPAVSHDASLVARNIDGLIQQTSQRIRTIVAEAIPEVATEFASLI
jgi:uncharacterized membrane protein YqiK